MQQNKTALGVVSIAALSMAAITGYAVARRWREDQAASGPTDAPAKTLRSNDRGGSRLVGRTVTIARPRDEVYRRWRDASRFPEFMENVSAVEPLGDGTFRWTVKGPAGQETSFTTRIVEERPGERLAWESTGDSPIRTSGRVEFRDAPGDRGTQVDLMLSYDPPGGTVGVLIASLFQREPAIQARRDLKRFKQLMETGEVARVQTLAAT